MRRRMKDRTRSLHKNLPPSGLEIPMPAVKPPTSVEKPPSGDKKSGNDKK